MFIERLPSMFLELGVEKAVFADLDACDKTSAIRSMVRIMAEKKCLARSDAESISRAILGREELGSTGIGGGVAVPHTRHPKVSTIVVGWFIARKPFDFSALDGEPVWLLNCMISPPNQPGPHLNMMISISALMKHEEFLNLGHIGIDRLEEFLRALKDSGGVRVCGTWPGSKEHHDALACEAELVRIGGGLQHLEAEETRLRVIASEGGWHRCEAELNRIEALLNRLGGELSHLGAAAIEEGTSRLTLMKGRLRIQAAEAKCNWLRGEIAKATGLILNPNDVTVRGRDVSIRALAKCSAERDVLRHKIASLPGMDGYHTEIAINLTPASDVAFQNTMPDAASMFSTFQVSMTAYETDSFCEPSEPGFHDHRESLTAEEKSRRDEAERDRLERAIRDASGRRLRSLTIRIKDRDVSIAAKASRFWQRRGLRRTIESLQCFANYRYKIEVV